MGLRGHGIEVKGQMYGGTSEALQALFPAKNSRLAFTNTASELTLQTRTRVVRVFPTEDCWIKFGPAPVAAIDDGESVFCPAGVMQFLLCFGGNISVIRDSADGSLHVMEGESA